MFALNSGTLTVYIVRPVNRLRLPKANCQKRQIAKKDKKDSDNLSYKIKKATTNYFFSLSTC